MHKIITQAHIGSVALFMFILFIRLIVMGTRSEQVIEKFSSLLRLPNTLLGIIILGTGVYLLWSYEFGFQMFMVVKLGLIAIAFPVTVVGSTKKNVSLMGLGLVLWGLVMAVAFFRPDFLSNISKFRDNPKYDAAVAIDTAQLNQAGNDDLTDEKKYMLEGKNVYYEAGCAQCHNKDGDSGYQDTKNLRISKLSDHQIREVIINGRETMPGRNNLTEDQMKKLIHFVKSLRAAQDMGPSDLSK